MKFVMQLIIEADNFFEAINETSVIAQNARGCGHPIEVNYCIQQQEEWKGVRPCLQKRAQ